jgi:prepilin-type N-terminal cleavage/methylation domain-containing protein
MNTVKGFSLLELLIVLMLTSIMTHYSMQLLWHLPSQLIHQLDTSHIFLDLGTTRLEATYTDHDKIITAEHLPDSFLIKGRSQKIGYKPYFKTKYANTIRHKQSPFKVSLSVGLSTLNLK